MIFLKKTVETMKAEIDAIAKNIGYALELLRRHL